MKPETKFWHEIKKNTKQISWTRLENLSAFGTPDLLGYNTNRHFFTLELKVTRANKIKFSPHQIAFLASCLEAQNFLREKKFTCTEGREYRSLLLVA